ncbi:neutral zinc metallopeptidase [Dyella tabacisoli]|uniref:Neutral zinc metallopeptidase n=1 Tax=Dyella tabacisoli TaxID=2282381 RepID=A0A369UZE9_9GAMM|nr:neutral zinc metallopeptidase [Dyella tabacisoli]RDD83699.1 neutral zinc metallopeptidase [Dyella tabacisoli]
MDWQKGRPSDNVEEGSSNDQGGGGGFPGGGKGLGLGGIIVLLVLSLIFKRDLVTPFMSDGGGTGQGQTSVATAQPDRAIDCHNPGDKQVDFVCRVFGDTEDTWGPIFSGANRSYALPKLHLFRGQVGTACGAASTAVGPFYCPGDQKVYLDLSFFQELQDRFNAAGDFARAYVIAHEVGHHVQKLLGVFDQVEQARRRGARMEGADGLSVRQELQADCFAGVWANHSQQRLQWLQSGDVESALNAASKIGDDSLQQQAQGRVVPDSFTHGTSAQRVKWFRTGFDGGDIQRCDTFSGTP